MTLVDVIRHLSFGVRPKMKLVCNKLNEIAERVRNKVDKLLIISDHGINQIGRFWGHSNYGSWSTNFEISLKAPQITDIWEIIK